MHMSCPGVMNAQLYAGSPSMHSNALHWHSPSIACILLQDTFLDAEHLRQSFPGHEVELKQNATGETVRPFRITFPEQASQEQPPLKGKRKVCTGMHLLLSSLS